MQSRWTLGQLTFTHTRIEKLPWSAPATAPGGSEMNAPARSSCLSRQNCPQERGIKSRGQTPEQLVCTLPQRHHALSPPSHQALVSIISAHADCTRTQHVGAHPT